MGRVVKILLGILIIFIFVFIVNLYEMPKVGTFDDLVLDDIDSEVNFASMRINKQIVSNFKNYQKEEKDLKKINKVINYLGGLKLRKVTKRSSTKELDTIYGIYFFSEEKDLIFGLKISSSNSLVINKGNELVIYKIMNDKNFIENIESIFQSISSINKNKHVALCHMLILINLNLV